MAPIVTIASGASGCSNRPDFSPAESRRLLHPPALSLPGQPLRQRDAPCPKQGRSKRIQMILPSLLVYVVPEDGPDESPTVRVLLTRPPKGRYFPPALPSDCCAIDFPGRALSPGSGLQFATPLFREWPRPPFPARNNLTRPTPSAPRRALFPCEHIPLVRVLRARRAPGRSLPILLKPRVARAPFLFNDPSKLAHYLLSRGGLAWSPTPHVERHLLHRGGFVSTGGPTRLSLFLLADFFRILSAIRWGPHATVRSVSIHSQPAPLSRICLPVSLPPYFNPSRGVPSNQAVYLNIPGWTSISTQVILSAEIFSRRACSNRDSGLGASYSQ